RHTTSGVRRSGWRRSSSEPFEIGEPDLDERPDRLLEACLARRLERLLCALPRLRGIDTLLEPVVARDQQLLDALARRFPLHKPSVTRQDLVQFLWGLTRWPPRTCGNLSVS